MASHKQETQTAFHLAPAEPPPLPWWLSGLVIVGSLLIASGGVIALAHPAMLASPRDEINGAVHIYAGYVAARNLPIALLLLVTFGIGARRALSALMALTGLIQLVDAVMDGVEGRWTLVPGVLVFAIAFLTGAAWLVGQPFWKAAAWRDCPLDSQSPKAT